MGSVIVIKIREKTLEGVYIENVPMVRDSLGKKVSILAACRT